MITPFADFVPDAVEWNAYNALALAHACNVAYASDFQSIQAGTKALGLDPARVYVVAPPSTILQAVIFDTDQAVIMAFRGTRPSQIKDWMTDLQMEQVAFNDYFIVPDIGKVHEGFGRLLASGWTDIFTKVQPLMTQGKSLWITGHSLGGAIAVLAAAVFTFAIRKPVNGVYTYGQPRVGNLDFCTHCDGQFGRVMFRHVNDSDLITRMPPRLVPAMPPAFYGHSGNVRYFDAVGGLHADEHWWNAFLTEVEVGYAKMPALLAAPIADHYLERIPGGYIDRLERYIAAGGPPLLPAEPKKLQRAS